MSCPNGKPCEEADPGGVLAPGKLMVGGTKYPATISLRPTNKASESLILAGAGIRNLTIPGPGNTTKTLSFTTIGIYVAPAILDLLSHWKGKSAAELLKEDEFFTDVIEAPVEKTARIVMLRDLSGLQFAEKSGTNVMTLLYESGKCGDKERTALQQYHSIFQGKNCLTGSSIIIRSKEGLRIVFMKDDSIPTNLEALTAPDHTVDNRLFADTFLATILGKQSVSPAAKSSFALGMSNLLKRPLEIPELASKENREVGELFPPHALHISPRDAFPQSNNANNTNSKVHRLRSAVLQGGNVTGVSRD